MTWCMTRRGWRRKAYRLHSLVRRIAWFCLAPLRFVVAPDVFVSYSGSINYVDRLCEQLSEGNRRTRIRCAVDRHEARIGRSGVPEAIKRAARWSRLRVVVVSPGSMTSLGMHEELQYAVRRPDPRTLLIVFKGDNGTADPAPESARWYRHVRQARRVMEAMPDWRAPLSQQPSPQAVGAIRTSCNFIRQSQRIQIASLFALAWVSLAVAAGAWQATRATQAAVQANALDQAAGAIELAQRTVSEIPNATRMALQSLSQHWNEPAADFLRNVVVSTPPLKLDLKPTCGTRHVAVDERHQTVAFGFLGRLCIVDLRTGAVVAHSLADKSYIGALAFDANGVLWAFPGMESAPEGVLLHRFEPSGWKAMPTLPMNVRVFGAWPSPDGQWMALSAGAVVQGQVSQPERLLIMHTRDGPQAARTLGDSDTRRRVHRVEFAVHGNWLFASTDHGYEGWTHWQATGPASPPQWPQPGASAPPLRSTPQLRTGKAYFATVIDTTDDSDAQVVVIRRLVDRGEVKRFEARPLSMAWSTQDELVVLEHNGTIIRWHQSRGLVRYNRAAPDLTTDAADQQATRLAVSGDGRCVFYSAGSAFGFQRQIQALLGAATESALRLGVDAPELALKTLGNGCSLLALGPGRLRLWGDLPDSIRPANVALHHAGLVTDATQQRMALRGMNLRRNDVYLVSDAHLDQALRVSFREDVSGMRFNSLGLPEIATASGLHAAQRWPPQQAADFQLRPWPAVPRHGAGLEVALPAGSAWHAVGATTYAVVLVSAQGARQLKLPGEHRRLHRLWLSRAGDRIGVLAAPAERWEFFHIEGTDALGPVLVADSPRDDLPLESGSHAWLLDRGGEGGAADRSVTLLQFDLATLRPLARRAVDDRARVLCADTAGALVALATGDGKVEVLAASGTPALRRIARVATGETAVACNFDAGNGTLDLVTHWGLQRVPIDQRLVERARQLLPAQPEARSGR